MVTEITTHLGAKQMRKGGGTITYLCASKCARERNDFTDLDELLVLGILGLPLLVFIYLY